MKTVFNTNEHLGFIVDFCGPVVDASDIFRLGQSTPETFDVTDTESPVTEIIHAALKENDLNYLVYASFWDFDKWEDEIPVFIDHDGLSMGWDVKKTVFSDSREMIISALLAFVAVTGKRKPVPSHIDGITDEIKTFVAENIDLFCVYKQNVEVYLEDRFSTLEIIDTDGMTIGDVLEFKKDPLKPLREANDISSFPELYDFEIDEVLKHTQHNRELFERFVKFKTLTTKHVELACFTSMTKFAREVIKSEEPSRFFISKDIIPEDGKVIMCKDGLPQFETLKVCSNPTNVYEALDADCDVFELYGPSVINSVLNSMAVKIAKLTNKPVFLHGKEIGTGTAHYSLIAGQLVGYDGGWLSSNLFQNAAAFNEALTGWDKLEA